MPVTGINQLPILDVIPAIRAVSMKGRGIDLVLVLKRSYPVHFQVQRLTFNVQRARNQIPRTRSRSFLNETLDLWRYFLYL